jgi:hypothetical protein
MLPGIAVIPYTRAALYGSLTMLGDLRAQASRAAGFCFELRVEPAFAVVSISSPAAGREDL